MCTNAVEFSTKVLSRADRQVGFHIGWISTAISGRAESYLRCADVTFAAEYYPKKQHQQSTSSGISTVID